MDLRTGNDVLAVVVTFNREDLLAGCVGCLLSQEGASCDVLIVDNGSSDGTGDMVRERFDDARVTYFDTGDNLGGSGGFHLGLYWAVSAGYRYAWVLDDDAYPSPDALAELRAQGAELGTWGFLSSAVHWTDGSVCRANRPKRTLFQHVNAAAYGSSDPVPIMMGSFVSMLIPTAVVREVGLPLAEYFIWTDDYEFSGRIAKRYPCYFVPTSKVTHVTAANMRADLARAQGERVGRMRMLYRNDVHCYRQYGLAGRAYLAAKGLYTAADVVLHAPDAKGERLGILAEGLREGHSFMAEPYLFEPQGEEATRDASRQDIGEVTPAVARRLFRAWPAAGAALSPAEAEQADYLRKIAEHGLATRIGERERIGYGVLGPLLYGYTTWLHALVRETSPDELWFLAREGRLLMQALELCYPQEPCALRYVRTSRVALCRASASRARDAHELLSLLSCLLNRVETLSDLLALLGIDASAEDLASLGVDGGDAVSTLDGEVLYRAVRQRGAAHLEGQTELALAYLGEGAGHRTILISDVGWAGTIQALLQELLPDDRFVGAYYAVSSFYDRDVHVVDRGALERHGYWCAAGDWDVLGAPVRFSQSAFEALFVTEEGMTLGYERTADGVVPVTAVVDDEDAVREAVDDLADAALAFVSDVMAAGQPDEGAPVSARVALLPYLNTMVRPSEDAVRLFRGLAFMTQPIVARHDLPFYLLHPRDALHELERTNSKAIWLRSVFGVPFPYYELLRLLTGGLGLRSAYARKVERIGHE